MRHIFSFHLTLVIGFVTCITGCAENDDKEVAVDDQTICIAAVDNGTGSFDPVLLALNSDGNDTWTWQIAGGQDLDLRFATHAVANEERGLMTWSLVGQGPLENTDFLEGDFGSNGAWAVRGFQFDETAGNGGLGSEKPFVMAGTRQGSLSWFKALRNGSNTIWPTSIDLANDGYTYVAGGFAETSAEASVMTGEVVVKLKPNGTAHWGITTNDGGAHTIESVANRGTNNGCFIKGTYDDGVATYSYLAGITSEGTIAWAQEATLDTSIEEITFIRGYNDGTCLIAGQRVDAFNDSGAFLARINANGGQEWWSYIDAESSNTLIDASPTPSGGAIILLSDGGNGQIISRLSGSGEMIFAKRISNPLGGSLSLYQGIPANTRDSFYVSGITDETPFSLATTSDAVMLELDPQGNLGNENCLTSIPLSLSVLDANMDSAQSAWVTSEITDTSFFGRVEIANSSPSSTLKQAICESAGS